MSQSTQGQTACIQWIPMRSAPSLTAEAPAAQSRARLQFPLVAVHSCTVQPMCESWRPAQPCTTHLSTSTAPSVRSTAHARYMHA